MFVVINENILRKVVKEYLEKEIFNDIEVLEVYIVYVVCYMNILEEYGSYDFFGEKLDIEKGIDF